jgi:hypothetical protein
MTPLRPSVREGSRPPSATQEPRHRPTGLDAIEQQFLQKIPAYLDLVAFRPHPACAQMFSKPFIFLPLH